MNHTGDIFHSIADAVYCGTKYFTCDKYAYYECILRCSINEQQINIKRV